MIKHSGGLGDAPVQVEYREKMQAVAEGLDRIFNGETRGKDRKVGFVLLVFEYGARPTRANYISNGADRKDIVRLMKEQIRRFESQPKEEGHA